MINCCVLNCYEIYGPPCPLLYLIRNQVAFLLIICSKAQAIARFAKPTNISFWHIIRTTTYKPIEKLMKLYYDFYKHCIAIFVLSQLFFDSYTVERILIILDH